MGLLSPQIATAKMVPLCRKLATAYDAGIPITRALEMTANQAPDRRVRDILQTMEYDIRQGATLAEAGRKHTKHLSPIFVQLLAAGEQGGRLDTMLRDLADYYEDRLSLRRKIVGALAYPVLLLIVAWFLGTFALRLVSQVLASFQNRGATGLGDYFRDYMVFQMMAMVVLAVIIAVIIVLSRMGLFRWVTGIVSTHVWPFADVVRKLALARFFRTLSLLLGSGLGVIPAIKAAASVVSNPYIERDLLRAIAPIKEGVTMVEAFASSRYLTPTAREMLYVGEESGELEQSLRKVSEYHAEEAAHATNKLVVLFGVLVVLGVTCGVGAVIILFYVKLYGGIYNELGF